MSDVTAALADDRLTVMGLLAEAFGGSAAKGTEQLAGHGLGRIEFEVLLRLARSPGGALRMTDLSAQTTLSTSGVTRVVDRLGAAGLVCRRACETDRRSTFAVVTGAGLDRLAAALPEHLDFIEEWVTGRLTPDQLEGLVRA